MTPDKPVHQGQALEAERYVVNAVNYIESPSDHHFTTDFSQQAQSLRQSSQRGIFTFRALRPSQEQLRCTFNHPFDDVAHRLKVFFFQLAKLIHVKVTSREGVLLR
jgi:hypothetical protein